MFGRALKFREATVLSHVYINACYAWKPRLAEMCLGTHSPATRAAYVATSTVLPEDVDKISFTYSLPPEAIEARLLGIHTAATTFAWMPARTLFHQVFKLFTEKLVIGHRYFRQVLKQPYLWPKLLGIKAWGLPWRTAANQVTQII